MPSSPEVPGARPVIIEELRAIQDTHGYLPAAELRALAERTQTPLYHLQGLASFYPHFRLAPPPAIDLRVCADLSCHLNGADDLRSAVEARVARLGPSGVAIREVSCLGQCDCAPAASVNDAIVARLTSASLYSHVEAAAAGRRFPHPEVQRPEAPLRIDPYAGGQRYEALRKLLASRDAAGTLAALKESGLRGLGGAGFPTGLKWEIVRNAPGDAKYVVCNADESEPGTIKDRFIMEHIPHLVIEGMVLAGVVTGARTGIIYIRHEYEAQRVILEQELEQCQRAGLVGRDLLGSGVSFDLSIFVSPGGYICGEESALLEALEDRRAEPRNKPPFPGTHGLYNKPTVINNVETFAFVPPILLKGVEWFKAEGRSGAPGLKFVGVSGHVARPGVYEIPMGTPTRELIFDRAGGVSGGRRLKAFAPSGPSSGFLPPAMLDVPLDFKSLADAGSMLGSGAIVVCAEGTCMLDMALNAVRFFKNESCGKCVPCRVGSAKMVDILTDISRGRGRREDLDLIGELSEALALTSICGLGQVAPNPIGSVLTHFRDEVEEHLARRRCPSGVCAMA
ncbi:MAG: NAD(P)H-dependent oxidoreductase subunit E [Candidatus Rokubacteria bacterium]|nr:NAD(P)H-dependent oxidoreductase subunit E [Candidatus Rokubacteria bacterium]